MDDRAILQKIERQPRQQAGFKQLVRELGVHGAERRQLGHHLEKLVARGALVEVESGKYALPKAAAQKHLISGRLTMHRDGYGFVIPDDAALREQLNGDIYIPPPAVGSAMHGDRVLVEMSPVRRDHSGRSRAEGRIARIAGRAHPTVVGTFHYGERHTYVTPIDDKITQENVVPFGEEWPASQPEQEDEELGRHRVIGKEARRRNIPARVEAGDSPAPSSHSQ